MEFSGAVMLTVTVGFWTPIILNGYGSGQSEVTIAFLAAAALMSVIVLLSMSVTVRKLSSYVDRISDLEIKAH